MADEDQSSTDESADQTPTPEELQAAELAKTRQALLVSAAMQQSEAQLPNALPTRAAPIAPPPPPMTGTQPPPPPVGGPSPAFRGMPQGAPVQSPRVAPIYPPSAQPLNLPVSSGRMYMGPSGGSALNEFTAGRGPSSVNLMPPPSGPQPSRLQQAQAQDRPGSRTVAIQDEPPYSDASLANQQNMMRYNAMKAFDAGDRSPETMAAAMGVTGRTLQPKTHFGPNGQVLQEQNGKIIEVRPPDAQKVAATKPNALLEKTILQLQKDISADRRDLAKKPLVAGVPDERPAMLHKKQQQLAAMTDQYNQAFQGTPPTTASGTSPAGPIQAPAPQGRPVKDKSGKTWIYTGTATDPKTDKDPSHWSAP